MVAKAPTKGTTPLGPRSPVMMTMVAIRTDAGRSQTYSRPGMDVVSWMTVAARRPMTAAWARVGRSSRIARQYEEMTNSGWMPVIASALPTVRLRMKPAASRIATRTRALTSRPAALVVVTVRVCVVSDMGSSW